MRVPNSKGYIGIAALIFLSTFSVSHASVEGVGPMSLIASLSDMSVFRLEWVLAMLVGAGGLSFLSRFKVGAISYDAFSEGRYRPGLRDLAPRLSIVIKQLFRFLADDPQNNSKKIIDGVRKFFIAVQKAKTEQNIQRLSLMLHSSLYREWRDEILKQQRRGVYMCSRDILVNSLDVVEAKNDADAATQNEFVVRLNASLVEEECDWLTSKVLNSQKMEIIEYWSFARENNFWKLSKVCAAAEFEKNRAA